MAQLAPMMQLRARFENKCGHPLAGGNVFAFEAGTSDPKATYADVEGTIPNTHPIKLDYRGEADIFLLSGRYRFVVYSCTGEKIYDVDNVGEWFGAIGANNVIDGDKNQHEINIELNQLVIDESARAVLAEATLDTKISNEITRATAAEAVIDAKVNANGVGNRAYKTYALMDADKANIPAKSKVTVTNDSTTSNNGDWNWDGTTFTKSAYDPIAQAAADATAKANTAESNAKTYSDAKVDLPLSVSQYLVSKSPDVSVPKFGDVTPGTTSTSVSAGTYVLLPPASVSTIIKRFSVISNITSGDIELRTYTASGTTFTMQKSIGTVHVSKVGLNEFGINDFLPFTVNAGEYVAAVVKNTGAMVYSGSSTNDMYYSNGSTGTAPIVGTAGKFYLKCAFFDTNGSERAKTFIDYLQQASDESSVNFSNILASYSAISGLTATPSAKSGTNNGIAHMCIGTAINGFGTVSQIEVYSAVAGSAQVGVYSRTGTTFNRKRFKDVTLVAGLNTISLNLAVSNGDYIGLKTTAVGMIEYESNTSGHQGMYVSNAGFTDNQFTVNSTTPIMSFAYQMRFTLTLKMLSSDVADKPWIGLKYTSFGDSITWYNGRTFANTHIESGQLVKGYQSYIVDALGCTLDNQGQSGWTMLQIYASAVNPYNFADVYLTTITSGANDQRTGVPVGTIAAIGSTFNTSTYAGAMQAAIEHVIASNPATKIVLITPIRGWYNEYNTSNVPNPDPSTVGVLKPTYPDMVIAIGKLYGLPVVDFYYDTELNDLNKSYFLGDNPAVFTAYLLHPMNRFFQRMGEILLATLKNL